MPSHHFSRHYSLAEAEELLPEIRIWFEALCGLRSRMADQIRFLDERIRSGHDVGGKRLEEHIIALSGFYHTLREFSSRDIIIKDYDRGLVDFPHLRDGREVFLCWEKDEPGIGFWHELDSGYSGRKPL